jgi:cystathionine gamma-synthase
VSVDRSTIWPYEDGKPGDFYYQRNAHPTGVAAEKELGKLEGGHALLFPSGAGATTAFALAFCKPGDTIALAEGAYFGTHRTFDQLEPWGLRVVEFDQTGSPPEGVDVVWLEAPSNPFLTMPNFDAAARHPARVVVDATAATPIHLRPLEHGADFVLHSATKYLAGHDDALLGAVVCKTEDDAQRLRDVRTSSGIVAAPDAAYLLLRGLKTLEIRVNRQTETAREVARRLEAHPKVTTVRYAGIGGLLSFDVADGDAAHRVETSVRLITNATSLGGPDTLIETRARWEPHRVPPGLLRLSVGLEAPEEIWQDLAQALETA